MLLGIDLGTASVKVLLLDEGGEVRGEAQRAYPVNAPASGWAESDPQTWWEATVTAVQTAVGTYAPEVRALGLSGQMHGVVLCHEDGEVLRPAILWADSRSHAGLALYERLSPAQRQRLANPLAVGMAGMSLLWLRHHEPDSYNRARYALQPKDWLRLKLTGEAFAEPSDASGTLLYDLQADGWAYDVVEKLELNPDLLAPLTPSAAPAGTLAPAVARALYLPAGIPVAGGAGDTPAAALGSGLLHEGEVQLTVGTGAQITAIRHDAVTDPALRTHLYRAATERGYYALAAMQNAGIALEWLRSLLGYDWREMYDDAFSVSPGCQGLTFLPYLTGERTPHLDPHARGHFLNLSLHHTRAHLARAAFEGVAFSLRDGLAALAEVGITPPNLRLAGGGTVEPRWRQLLADTLQKPLYATQVSSASARGAALLGGVAGGVFATTLDTGSLAPLPQHVAQPQADERLEAAYGRFRRAYPSLKKVSNA